MLAALGARGDDRTAFGAAVEPDELVAILTELTGSEVVARATGRWLLAADDPRARWAAEVAAYAHGWEVVATDAPAKFGCGRVTP